MSSLTGNNNYPGRLDTRNDLGYGRTTQKYHKPRVHGDPTFPYVEPPTEIDDDLVVDDETIDSIIQKLQQPRAYDPLPYNDTEGQYYAAGNTKLSEASNTMKPIPDLYKNRSRTPLGTSPRYPQGPADGFSTRSRPTGDRYGYSTMYGEDDESEEPAYTLQDIAEKQIDELRKFIRLSIMEQMVR